MVSESSLGYAREALRARELERLLGLAECSWLDVKSGIYPLEHPGGAEELLKDVAAFANTQTGGLLIVGFATRREHGQEILDQIRPVPRKLADLDRHRKLLQRIIPRPRYVTVEWIDRGDDKGVMVIDVPAQPAACLPYVVPGPARTGKGSELAAAIPVRDADRTDWLPPAEIQRLLAAGWAQTGGYRETALQNAISEMMAAARRINPPDASAIRAGEGDPIWARRFQEVAGALANRIKLGAPAGLVFHEGPGPVQHFDGDDGEAWVLCALPGSKPVMVAEPVWEAVREAGSGAPGADAFTALGFPVLRKDVPPEGRLILPHSGRVELAGGKWGPGFLVSSFPHRGQHWEAVPAFSFSATREGTIWTSGPRVPQLRIRAVAVLPVADPDQTITPYQTRQLADEILYSDLALAVQHLAVRRGASLRADCWEEGRTGRSTDRYSLAYTVAAPDGRSALAAEVMLSLPGSAHSAIVAIAELRIEDLAAWQDALQACGASVLARSQMLLSLPELEAILSAAWRAVTHDLPSVLAPDLGLGPFSWPPVVELRVSTEQSSGHNATPPDLTGLIDFSPLGATDRKPLPEMSVTVSGPIQLSDEDRYKRTRKAIAYMAQGFGFSNAPADLLSARSGLSAGDG